MNFAVGGQLRQQRHHEYETGHQKQRAANQADRVFGANTRRHEKNCRDDKQNPAPQLKMILTGLRHG